MDSIPVSTPETLAPITLAAPAAKTKTENKSQLYKANRAVDIPIIAVGTGFSLYAFTKIYSKGASTEEQINKLNRSDINGFDRWAVYPYSKPLDKFSYYPFYASIPVPFIMMLARKDTRHDFWKLSMMYWETLSITGFFGSGSPLLIDRYRPYSYSITTPMDQRVSQNGKNSAFSGHVEVIAASTFFIAKVYSDYYPEKKWIMYGFATAATAGMAYIRLDGGMHFPSDILVGGAIGALSGILVPQFHKRNLSNTSLSILPFSNSEAKGLSLTYRFK